MRDFYEFEEKYHQNNGGVWKFIAIGLLFAILGAVLMFYLSPYIYERLGIDNPAIEEQQVQEEQGVQEEDATEQTDNRGEAFLNALNPVVQIAENISPAVVGITNRSVVAYRDWFFGDILEREQEGFGSGIIISEDGYIVTNAHVLANAEEIFVILEGGEEVPATIVGADEHSDVAVIKIDRTGLPVALLGDSDKVRPGELAVAIGNPLGHDLSGTITAGIVSAVNRRLLIEDRYLELIQTDAAINPGNSGGALVNSKGEVIGMNTLKATGAEGMGFAIPTNIFIPLVEQLKETGEVQRPWIGIQSRELTPEEAEELGYPKGILIHAVMQDGPASNAGLRPGDIIVGLAGRQVETFVQLREVIAEHNVGDSIEIRVWREGDILTFTVRLGQMRI